MNEQREIWVDNVKLIACILVAVGHFYQGIVGAGIILSSDFYQWFNQTVYSIHVQLFFLCSGYLYQKYKKINSFSAWKRHLLKKGIELGIPYFVFSTVTWFLKAVFSDVVNGQNTGLLSTLILTPTAPYWYLYVLFFVFLITPTFLNVKMNIIVLLGAIALKIVHLCVGETDIYVLTTLIEYEIWFVLGMCLAMCGSAEKLHGKKWRSAGVGLFGVFLIGSVVIFEFDQSNRLAFFLEGLIGCLSVVLLMINWNPQGTCRKILRGLSDCTMPVYLMHTIFAAGMRSVLMKIGIMNPSIHIILGLIISFVGPVIIAEIMKWIKLDVLLYPGKYIKLSKG